MAINGIVEVAKKKKHASKSEVQRHTFLLQHFVTIL
jgi:hypothetical protein